MNSGHFVFNSNGTGTAYTGGTEDRSGLRFKVTLAIPLTWKKDGGLFTMTQHVSRSKVTVEFADDVSPAQRAAGASVLSDMKREKNMDATNYNDIVSYNDLYRIDDNQIVMRESDGTLRVWNSKKWFDEEDMRIENARIAQARRDSLERIERARRESLERAQRERRDSLRRAEQQRLFDEVSADLGLSVRWAQCNVGATKPEGIGLYLSDMEARNYVYTPKNGVNFRTPTREEMQELVDNCTWTNEVLNGTEGYRVTGPNGNSIFIPAGGWYETITTMVLKKGSSVHLWTSSRSDIGTTYSLKYGKDGKIKTSLNNLNIRPVVAF